MHHVFRRARIYVGHMVVGTVLGPHARTYRDFQGRVQPLAHLPPLDHPPHSESPHEFSMRLAAHLCGDRPHRHHRARTKLVNLLTARTLLHGGLFCFVVCMHRACTCRANSSLVYGCAMVKENTMFLAALIIWSRLKSPTTAMLVGIGGRNGPPELFSLSSTSFLFASLYFFS